MHTTEAPHHHLDNHLASTQQISLRGRTGRRVELARYSSACGERAICGQRVDGAVRLTDYPANVADAP
jgi:hypothetical protein